MSQFNFEHGPKADETETCEICGNEYPVSDMAARFDSHNGYVCYRCD